MVLGTLIASFVRSFIDISLIVASNPWYMLKVMFMWYCVSMTATYMYFLWTHQEYMERLRPALAIGLAKSIGYGLICALALLGMYEFILQMMCASRFFIASKDAICELSLTMQDVGRLLKVTGGFFMILSAFWACHYIDPLLEEWHESHVVEGYGWLIISVSLICFGFFWWII